MAAVKHVTITQQYIRLRTNCFARSRKPRCKALFWESDLQHNRAAAGQGRPWCDKRQGSCSAPAEGLWSAPLSAAGTHKEQLDTVESGDDYMQRQLSLKGATQDRGEFLSLPLRAVPRAGLNFYSRREQCNQQTLSATWTHQRVLPCTWHRQEPTHQTKCCTVCYFSIFAHNFRK